MIKKENFKELRKSLELNQTQFGRLLGFANPQIRVSEIENKKRTGSLQVRMYVRFLNYLIEKGHKNWILKFVKELDSAT